MEGAKHPEEVSTKNRALVLLQSVDKALNLVVESISSPESQAHFQSKAFEEAFQNVKKQDIDATLAKAFSEIKPGLNFKKEVDSILAENDIISRLNELDRLDAGAKVTDSSLKWRPLGEPKKDSSSLRVKTKLDNLAKLKKEVAQEEQQFLSLKQRVSTRRDEIKTLQLRGAGLSKMGGKKTKEITH